VVPPIFHKATLAPSEQSGGASSPPGAFATYDIHAAALPGNPYDGHALGYASALIGNVLDRCITDAGYRGHNACPITSSRSTPPARSPAKRRRSSANAVLAVAGYNFRRLPAWLTFLLLGILIALGLAAQLPEIGFFTADLI
jgi:IS5 family transposase